MAEISKITLPTGSVYDIKDATARAAIANLQNTENVLSTDAASTPYGVQWKSGSTTITGTLVASAETVKKIYLVPNDGTETGNTYDEYLTLKINTNYSWEKIGTTKVDLSGLGDLAYKDTASTSYTPAGSVSQPTFTGNQLTSTGTATPSGTVTVTTATTTNKTATVGSTSGEATYTPAGSVSQPIFQGNTLVSTGSFKPTGSISFTNTNKTAAVSTTAGDVTYTPAGTVSKPTISVSAAGSTTTVNSLSSRGTLPTFSATVSNENLTLDFNQGTLPSSSSVMVKTSDATYEASTPNFSGTGVRLVTGNISVPSSATFSGDSSSVSVSGTPSGTVSQPSFSGTGVRLVTGNIAVPSTYTATFSGTSGEISVAGTPSGTVSKPTFSGTATTITVS